MGAFRVEKSGQITSLKGIGEKTAELFHKLNINTLEDLLFYYPRDYEKYEDTVVISAAQLKNVNAIGAFVIGNISSRKFGRITVTTLFAGDETGKLQLTFFNKPYIKNILQKGKKYIFRGIVQEKGKNLCMENPTIFHETEYEEYRNVLMPVYSTTIGLTNKTIRKAIKQAMNCEITEYLPTNIKEQYQLEDIKTAIEKIHFPGSMEAVISARKRLVFDEFFFFLMNIRTLKEHTQLIETGYTLFPVAETTRLIESLPYKLTKAQLRTWNEISEDLQGKYVMNRLVQGDVGSGKTILALLALLMITVNGFQGALMAPTEVLAAQHFESVNHLIKQYHIPFKPVLLTGSVSAKDKKEIYKKIESGEANLIIGTHALIQEKVIYKNLSLVVTDEQHRFGVRQRECFANKGENVHVLVMSATPIPRTLAIIIYGDLKISLVDELPSNRLPIKNAVVNTGYRKKAYEFMEAEILKGHQIYVVCPMVEEGELEGVENVLEYTDKLKSIFPESIRIASLHGQMPSKEKNKIMEDFSNNFFDILVSTTVIEVGVNVPNATVMMVENAERFGLAQLHQLRGRVGRGDSQSYCIFVSGSDNGDKVERLNILNKSNDGFFIAEEDMKLRGPGDLFGIRQSGIMNFRIGDVFTDAGILKNASQCADNIQEEDPYLESEENQLLNIKLKEIQSINVDFKSI